MIAKADHKGNLLKSKFRGPLAVEWKLKAARFDGHHMMRTLLSSIRPTVGGEADTRKPFVGGDWSRNLEQSVV